MLRTINSAGRAAALCLLWCACAPAADLRLYQAVEPHMGTLVRITLYAESAQQASTAFRAGFERIAQLDDALSDYKPQSEVNRICQSAAGTPVRVGEDLFRVLSASRALSEATGGAFDVTLGPVIRLWRQARIDHRLPAPEALAEAAARSGFRKLHLDPSARTVMLDLPGMQLDLGAIAKGYAADAALAVLAQAGIRRALVAASGDLAVGDPPPGQRGWRVGVDPHGGDGSIDRILELSNVAVSTSGDAEQNFEIGGKRYSHIVDPANNMGLTQPIAVTVVAERGIDADPLATAISVLGAERGLELLRRYPNSVALIVTGEDTEAKTVTSPGWARLVRHVKLP